MEQVKWVEVCLQMERNWPKLRLPPETVSAWFEAFGQHVDYALLQRVIMRLALEEPKPPSLADLRFAYRDVAPGRRRPVTDTMLARDEHARWDASRRAWATINGAMARHPKIREMFNALFDQYGRFDVSDENASLARQALIDEIKHLTPVEIEAANRRGRADSVPDAPPPPPVAGNAVEDFDPFERPAAAAG